jgi:parvulin-like peptidyl-prolyl isomerase
MRGRIFVGLTFSLTLMGCGWERPSLAAPPAGAVRPQSPYPGSPPRTPPIQPVARPRAADGAGPSPGVVTASIVARVNGQPILREELMNAASWRLEETKPRVPPAQWEEVEQKILEAEMEDLINRELLWQDATNRIKAKGIEKVREFAQKDFEAQLRRQKEQLKLKTDEELRDYLEKQGRSLEEMRRQFERSFLAMEYVRSMVKEKLELIDREAMLEYYQSNPKEFNKPERVVWQHLFIDIDRIPKPYQGREYAEMVWGKLKALKRTEEFAPLCEEFSHGPSRYRNGEGEGNERGQIRPAELEDLVFQLKPGQVGPIVEASNGFHMVRVAEYTPGGKVSFENACGEIKKKLQNQIGQTEYKRMIKELRDKAHIENLLDR